MKNIFRTPCTPECKCIWCHTPSIDEMIIDSLPKPPIASLENERLLEALQGAAQSGRQLERDVIVRYLRKPNEDGSACSAEREMLAQQIERGEHCK